MTATESDTTSDAVLPYLINDADEHSTPATARTRSTSTPTSATWRSGCHRVAATIAASCSYNGRPARFTFKNFQVVGSNEQLDEVGVKDSGSSDDEGGQVIPGSLLNRLNPLKDLDAEGRKEFAQKYRAMQEQLDNPADRLTVMDSQGIQCAVNFATLPGHRGGVRRRLRRPLRQPHRAQPLPRHRVGIQLRGPAVHAAVHLVRRSRRRAARSSKTS